MADLLGPLDLHAISEGKRILALLPNLDPGQAIKRIVLHWEVEAYGCVDAHYNIPVSLQNGLWVGTIKTDPRLNATDPEQDGYAAATWMRNSFSCSVGVSGMVGATESNFGSQPIQLHETEVACAVMAAVARKYNVDAMGAYRDLPALTSHAENAIADSYFPGDIDPATGLPATDTRWDYAILRPNADGSPATKAQAKATGALIRFRTHSYKLALP